MSKLIILKTLFSFFICIALSISCFAQDDDLPPGGGEGGDPDVIPLDGGLSILLAAGAAYGAKKIHDFRKGEKSEDTQ